MSQNNERPLDSRVVANSFITIARDRGDSLTMMQILKLVYIAHGYSLALLNSPLIRDRVEAWRHGPVIPAIYKALRHYGSAPVTDEIRDENGVALHGEISARQAELIEAVYDAYGALHAFQLSDLTHQQGTPWASVYNPDEMFIAIPNKTIAHYYNSKVNQPAGAS